MSIIPSADVALFLLIYSIACIVSATSTRIFGPYYSYFQLLVLKCFLAHLIFALVISFLFLCIVISSMLSVFSSACHSSGSIIGPIYRSYNPLFALYLAQFFMFLCHSFFIKACSLLFIPYQKNLSDYSKKQSLTSLSFHSIFSSSIFSTIFQKYLALIYFFFLHYSFLLSKAWHISDTLLALIMFSSSSIEHFLSYFLSYIIYPQLLSFTKTCPCHNTSILTALWSEIFLRSSINSTFTVLLLISLNRTISILVDF